VLRFFYTFAALTLRLDRGETGGAIQTEHDAISAVRYWIPRSSSGMTCGVRVQAYPIAMISDGSLGGTNNKIIENK